MLLGELALGELLSFGTVAVLELGRQGFVQHRLARGQPINKLAAETEQDIIGEYDTPDEIHGVIYPLFGRRKRQLHVAQRKAIRGILGTGIVGKIWYAGHSLCS
jgi:hypothetical protein